MTATTTQTASLVCCVDRITAGGQALMTLMTAVIKNYRKLLRKKLKIVIFYGCDFTIGRNIKILFMYCLILN